MDEGDPARLAGAEFVLEKYKDDDPYNNGLDTDWGTGGKKTASETEEVPGEFNFTGVSIGYYKLVETKCPRGYVKAAGDPLFQVYEENSQFNLRLLERASDGTLTPTEGNRTETIIVDNDDNAVKLVTYGNTPGAALPATGGPGTRMYHGIGLALMLGALTMLLRRRRQMQD